MCIFLLLLVLTLGPGQGILGAEETFVFDAPPASAPVSSLLPKLPEGKQALLDDVVRRFCSLGFHLQSANPYGLIAISRMIRERLRQGKWHPAVNTKVDQVCQSLEELERAAGVKGRTRVMRAREAERGFSEVYELETGNACPPLHMDESLMMGSPWEETEGYLKRCRANLGNLRRYASVRADSIRDYDPERVSRYVKGCSERIAGSMKEVEKFMANRAFSRDVSGQQGAFDAAVRRFWEVWKRKDLAQVDEAIGQVAHTVHLLKTADLAP